MAAFDKLAELRAILSEKGLDAFIVGSEDAHQSEYVADADLRREFISGFSGSAGTALILKDAAYLWTDGRYFLQAEQQLSSAWTLMKSGMPQVLDLYTWIKTNLHEGAKVGIDPWLLSATAAGDAIKAFSTKAIELIAVEENPVDIVWQRCGTRPSYPLGPIEVLSLDRAGVSHTDKIAKLVTDLEANNAIALVVTMLDEVAWLLNIRGTDVDYNPVVISYAVVTTEEVAYFVNPLKVTEEVRNHFGQSVQIHGYDQIETYLKTKSQLGKILIDSTKVSWRLKNAIGNAAIEKLSPITLPKSIKNDHELQGIIQAHIRDGVALTAFLHWLTQRVQQEPGTFTEYDVSIKIEEFRSKMTMHVQPSFPTIAGYGPNGAIIHYRPEKETALPLGVDSMFLLDSGAQYRDGTTDVTRYNNIIIL
jgi:Xaa-Pro aminopeptidase